MDVFVRRGELIHALALDDSLYQGPVTGGQIPCAPAQCLGQLNQVDVGLARGEMRLLDRADALGNKDLRPFDDLISAAGGFQ